MATKAQKKRRARGNQKSPGVSTDGTIAADQRLLPFLTQVIADHGYSDVMDPVEALTSRSSLASALRYEARQLMEMQGEMLPENMTDAMFQSEAAGTTLDEDSPIAMVPGASGVPATTPAAAPAEEGWTPMRVAKWVGGGIAVVAGGFGLWKWLGGRKPQA